MVRAHESVGEYALMGGRAGAPAGTVSDAAAAATTAATPPPLPPVLLAFFLLLARSLARSPRPCCLLWRFIIVITMRAELIGHFKPCMTDIYLHVDARMADHIRTHPYAQRSGGT